VKGTGFSPYIKSTKPTWASAPEGRFFQNSRKSLALCALLAASLAPLALIAEAPAESPATQPREASLDDYRQHLEALSALTQACAQTRDPKTCDPNLIGPDDRVAPLAPTAPRQLVRYNWLRVLFLNAQDKDSPSPATKQAAKPGSAPGSKPETKDGAGAGANAKEADKDQPAAAKEPAEEEGVRPPKPTTSALLAAAVTRLAHDLAQTNAAPEAPPSHAAERAAMKQVLAGRDFRNLEEPTAKDSMLEKVGNWLNKIFDSAAKLGVHGAWVGRLLTWGFILAVCVALVWALLQLELRWRLRLVPEDRPLAPGAASAIHWQLWLDDANRAAAQHQWREAIHFLYWAAISRLESKRLWPADRARTPREYLALVAGEDPRKPGLAALTGSFERYWYGGRSAAEHDYQGAEALAAALIDAGTPAKPAEGGKP
jgi:hypothetical protein